MVIHNSNKYIRPYPPKESWPYLVSVGKLTPSLVWELVHPALTTAWLSLADDFWCSLSAQKDSSSLGGLATGNLTMLQWIYAQHKMDLFFFVCVCGEVEITRGRLNMERLEVSRIVSHDVCFLNNHLK